MLNFKGIMKRNLDFNIGRTLCNKSSEHGRSKIRRALVLTKHTRYAWELHRNPNMTQEQLLKKLKIQQADFDTWLGLHKEHTAIEQRVTKCLEENGFEVKVTNRVNLTAEMMNWADILIPIGGDGTFLIAAGKNSPLTIKNRKNIPIVGFNSNPTSSEGRLLLPEEYTKNPDAAIRRIKDGDYRLMHRSRIRVTLLDHKGPIPRFVDLVNSEFRDSKRYDIVNEEQFGRDYILPFLALNEVFIGETLAARVSHLQISIDGGNVINKTKGSGLCVCTGTGSTSWHQSINSLSVKEVEQILKILPKDSINLKNINFQKVADTYNKHLLFSPDDPRMCYSIREQINANVWPVPPNFAPRDFIKSLTVQSKCVDASLVVDGSASCEFNEGAKIHLEIYPDDDLLTINLD